MRFASCIYNISSSTDTNYASAPTRKGNTLTTALNPRLSEVLARRITVIVCVRKVEVLKASSCKPAEVLQVIKCIGLRAHAKHRNRNLIQHLSEVIDADVALDEGRQDSPMMCQDVQQFEEYI